ncbi:hypothetical protein Bpfe_023219, partial [Biomphalaria pfeifferi]
MNFEDISQQRNDSTGQGSSLDIPDEVADFIRTICFGYIFPIVSVFGAWANLMNMWIYY